MVSIRAATVHDANSIAHVHLESWRTTYAGTVPDSYLASLNEADRASEWREWLTLDIQVYVADLDGEIVGFISGGRIREPLQTYDAELFTIYVLQHAQKHGIGTALLRKLANSLSAQDFNSMAVWVLESNASSRFYEKTGALLLQLKKTEVGGVMLPVCAFGWPDLKVIASA